MSAYNGEKYIEQQIESILAQKSVDVKLYVRDDGSTDSTLEILNKIGSTNQNLIIFSGENIGWKRSFFECLKNAGEADYYAFSDQDDVWLEDKLCRAVNQLENEKNDVALYVGNAWVTDEELNITGTFCPNDENPIEKKGFEYSALFLPTPGGLTQVFTPKAREMLLKLYPGGQAGHDSLLFKICLHFGNVIYDSVPKVLYRQHGNNAAGASLGVTWRLKKIMRKISRKEKFARYSDVEKAILKTFEREFNESKSKGKDLLLLVESYQCSLRNKVKLITMLKALNDDVLRACIIYTQIMIGKF